MYYAYCIQYSTNLHVMRPDTNCCFSLLINKGKPFTAIVKEDNFGPAGSFSVYAEQLFLY